MGIYKKGYKQDNYGYTPGITTHEPPSAGKTHHRWRQAAHVLLCYSCDRCVEAALPRDTNLHKKQYNHENNHHSVHIYNLILYHKAFVLYCMM